MRNDHGMSAIVMILLIALILGVIGVAIKFVFGRDGLYDAYQEQDYEYNKEEIIEKINLIIKEKYIKDYKYCNENNLKFEEVHTLESVMNYLLESNYIEVLKDIDGNDVQDQYYINPDSLNSDIATETLKGNGQDGNGTKLFKIIKEEENYNVYYVDKYGELENIGTLDFKPEEN